MIPLFRVLNICLFFTILTGVGSAYAQPCAGAINIFPYNEGFEAGDGGWIAGGTSSDWAWGTPSKPVITGAGGGNRCWITGGLTGSSYNNGENSWLMSPCFDLSSLQNPEIRFKIFWETEQRFDGAAFQYSTDGGNNWTLLGNTSSNNNCNAANWYNTGSITYLGNINGWTGNIQPNSGSCPGGNGSGAWLTARHTLSALAGQSNVRFRFLFGAGTTCNAFNGFAVDDISIASVSPTPVTITSSCITTNQLQFAATGNCPGSSHSWNFGDPASGTGNTSNSASPVHTFSAPGAYTVTLTTTSANGISATVTKDIVIIDASGQTNWPGRCMNLPDATLTVTASGSATGYIYSWDTNPPQTTTSVSNIGPGTYNVTVNAINACSAGVVFYLFPSQPLVNVPDVKDASCSGNDGSITANVSGGTAPYTYLWSNGNTGATIQNLAPGTYGVNITDAAGCTVQTMNITIRINQSSLQVNLGEDAAYCNNQNILLSPGSFDTYLWQDGSTGSTFTVTGGGTYWVQVTNANGCSGRDTIYISPDCNYIYFPSAFSPNNDGKNDLFGPLGNIAGLKNYSLSVFNRYGNRVFFSRNPFEKWDGRFKTGLPLSGNYVWISHFELNGRPEERKGSVLLIK